MEELSLKIAWRQLWKAKSFSLINLGGLAIGLCAAILLFLYVANEWQFNKQFANATSIYEVKVNMLESGSKVAGTSDLTPLPLAAAMKAKLPEVRSAAAISWSAQALLVNGQRSIKTQNRLAEPSILKVLSYRFIEGDAGSAFAKPNSIILTQSAARRLFGGQKSLGKSLKFMNFANLTVTGIVEDLPENMSYRFESLVSLKENQGIFDKKPQWNNYSFYTVLQLNEGVNIDEFNRQFRNFLKLYHQQAIAAPFIYPLLKTHLYGEFKKGKASGGRIQQVWIFIGLALGILLIACINFMNLATARAAKRAKEVGVRKTIGASRSSLILQFLLEAVLMVVSSLFLAVILAEVCLPLFNGLLHVNLSMGMLGVRQWTAILVLILVTGILSGSYPAFYLSSFSAASTVKGVVSAHPAAVKLRKVLVVMQFSCAVFLITGTLIIYKQLQFIKDRPIGYNSNQLVEMPIEGQLFQKYELLKSRLLSAGAVSAMCKTSGSISTQNSSTNGLKWNNMSEADKSINFNQLITTDDFTKTTGVKMVLGRDFNKEMASDSAALLLNSTAVKAMKLQNPIGQQVWFGGRQRTIVGVFEDIIWADPSKKEMPMVIAWGSFIPDVITMRLNPERKTGEALGLISKITKELNPVYPVEVKFVDQLYQQKFEKERTLSILSNLFGVLSIFISCLGLLGLSAYSAELRTKEIGIRKVLGASNLNIVGLLSWSFVKMVLIAIAVALPITWYAMDSWLMKFDFHIQISWWMMVLSSIAIILIAFLTVSYQAISAAKSDPIEAIRYE